MQQHTCDDPIGLGLTKTSHLSPCCTRLVMPGSHAAAATTPPHPNSELQHFRTDLSDLYRRLKARGYAASFLNTHFSKSHTWSERPQLLNKVTAPKPASGTERVFTFAVPYSRALETTNIARAIHEHEDILPPHLTDGEHLVAWKAASRLGSTVTTYRYTGDVP
jgi:hypothetical protein